MAGGRGERFWPASRSARPKQLLPIVGSRPMLAQTVERLGETVSADRIFIITNREHMEAIREMLPEIPPDNLVGEPMGRDTAPAVALAALLVKRRDPDAVFAILPADHVIHDHAGFQDVLDAAFEAAAQAPVLVTIGVAPTHPATGYGYIRTGEEVMQSRKLPVWKAEAFVEKPDRETAQDYLESGSYFWNAGMFVWAVRTLQEELGKHAPELSESFARMEAELEEGVGLEAVMEKHYPKLQKISVDYALMEKSESVVLIESAFDWDDVGSWPAVARHTPSDGSGNSLKGDVMLRDSENTIAISHDGHTLALLGVEDLIVVTTEDATLVCHRKHAQKLKKLVQDLSDDRPHLV